MKIISSKLFILLTIINLLIGCEKIDVNKQPDCLSSATRTVIVYMVANNDLYSNAINDIKQMEKGWEDINGNLIVYLSPLNGNPYLLKIERGKGDVVVSPIVKQYPSQNSCDKAVMKKVFDDIMELYPAQSYGVIMWSHATGWLPADMLSFHQAQKSYSVDPAAPRLKSFGDDRGYKMEITDLAEALPSGLDFIIFDACLMANIESLYELKDKTDYILASSTEILEMGYPYDKIMTELFDNEPDLAKVAEQYFNYYNALSGIARSATISLIKTSEIDKLAEISSRIIKNNFSKSTLKNLNLSSIQQLDTWAKNVFFDLGDFIQQAFNKADLSEFNEQLNKVVIYKKNTPQFYNDFYIKKHSGLNCYIPYSLSADFNKAYLRTKWGEASGLNTLLE